MTIEPRAFTADELRDKLIDHIRHLAKYWSHPKLIDIDGQPKTVEGRCNGLAFSILTLLDGDTLAIPAIDLVFSPHEDDKQYCIDHGENWIEPGTVISDTLHEYYYR